MVMDSLGIEVGASDSDNMKTLQRMKNETLASRGKRKHTEEFWSAVTTRFGVKSWGIVEEDNKPLRLSYLSMRIIIKDSQEW